MLRWKKKEKKISKKWNFFKKSRSWKPHPLGIKFDNQVLWLTFSTMPCRISMKRKLSFAFNHCMCMYVYVYACARTLWSLLHLYWTECLDMPTYIFQYDLIHRTRGTTDLKKKVALARLVRIQVTRIHLCPLVSRKSRYSHELL